MANFFTRETDTTVHGGTIAFLEDKIYALLYAFENTGLSDDYLAALSELRKVVPCDNPELPS
jgi:hypothetical protein